MTYIAGLTVLNQRGRAGLSVLYHSGIIETADSTIVREGSIIESADQGGFSTSAVLLHIQLLRTRRVILIDHMVHFSATAAV